VVSVDNSGVLVDLNTSHREMRDRSHVGDVEDIVELELASGEELKRENEAKVSGKEMEEKRETSKTYLLSVGILGLSVDDGVVVVDCWKKRRRLVQKSEGRRWEVGRKKTNRSSGEPWGRFPCPSRKLVQTRIAS